MSICAAKVPVLPVASGTVVVASVVDWENEWFTLRVLLPQKS